jgi:hypothetical protein
MMNTSKKGLRLLGKVARRILLQVIDDPGERNENSIWCFVDYASNTHKLNAVFDIYASNSEKDWHIGDKMKLIRITDELGRSFTEIPQGYKTICKFNFAGNIPTAIKKLPTLYAWGTSPNGINIYNHTELDLSGNSSYTELYHRYLALVLKELSASNKRKFRLNDIASIAEVNPKDHKSIRQVMSDIALTGKYREKEDELVLIEK